MPFSAEEARVHMNKQIYKSVQTDNNRLDIWFDVNIGPKIKAATHAGYDFVSIDQGCNNKVAIKYLEELGYSASEGEAKHNPRAPPCYIIPLIIRW